MTEPVSWPTVKRSLIAILRGIRPDEAEAIVETLIGGCRVLLASYVPPALRPTTTVDRVLG